MSNLDKPDTSFIVIYTEDGSVPNRMNYKCSESVDIREDCDLHARTIKQGFLDSDILKVRIRVKANQQVNEVQHPEMMIRPNVTSHSEDKFLFDGYDDFFFGAGGFESYHG